MRSKKDGIEYCGKSNRYSAISLIGFLHARRNGSHSALDLSRIMDRLVEEAAADDNLGNLGLVCWAASLMDDPERYERRLIPRLQRLPAALEKVETSLELSWMLTGLCRLYGSSANKSRIENIIRTNYAGLMNNYRQDSGLFCSQRPYRVRGSWKKDISYFSDQIYGVYALCTYSETLDDPAPVSHCLRLAEKLCSLQGELGQWPWLYNSHKGSIISMYPVYSVHQDAMAPMALYKLSDVSGVDFTPNILRGLAWIFGNNEMGIPMTDFHRGVIWRSIRKETKLSYKYALRMIKLAHIAGLDWVRDLANPFLSFAIDMECRPYHFGWLLVALCGRF